MWGFFKSSFGFLQTPAPLDVGITGPQNQMLYELFFLVLVPGPWAGTPDAVPGPSASKRICCYKIPLAWETKAVGPDKAMSLPLLSQCGFSLFPQLQRICSLVLRLFTEIITLHVQFTLEQ